MQSVFSRGECMMHVDKNADDHVVDQNLDRISREIAYVPLCGGSGPNVVHTIFFFFLNEYEICLPGGRRILAHVFRGLGFLDLGSYFQRTKGFWVLTHVFRGPKVLDLGSCFQRPRIFGSWLMFSEDQRFWILTHVFKDLGFLDLGSCFQRIKGFLGLWLMFSED